MKAAPTNTNLMVEFLLAKKQALGSFPLVHLRKHLRLAHEHCLMGMLKLIWVLMEYYGCGVLSHSSETLLGELSVGHPSHFGQCLKVFDEERAQQVELHLAAQS
jgi:hypothetical protein